MTLDTPPASLAIEPRTTSGSGLSVPVAKALAHLWLVNEAMGHEDWPFTNEAASAEISEAITHLRDIRYPTELLTETLVNELEAWTNALTPYAADLTSLALNQPDDSFGEPHRDDLQTLIRQTWTLLTLIDREITGIETADPGRTP